MNKRTRRLLGDCLIALILALGLAFVAYQVLNNQLPYRFALFLIPLIWLGLRQGAPAAILTGALAVLGVGWFIGQEHQWLPLILRYLVPVMSLVLLGLFTKNTQKTLNNRRYSSVYLNIITASILVSVVYYLLAFLLASYLLQASNQFSLTSLNFWLSCLLTGLITGGILSIMARLWPKLIIPPHSRYLSRKETSSLLND
ncbi:energy-coupled thiamine transporter ThiT [Eremococcus coleocola]|uniref:Thiamine transporter protein (Thia_YuaJ) n=1 Tax=Eremococcus coleocola ACS-139-V-Col8 TaxID=908337 RepID=E4KNY6_9LACT|nr:energy-coupled thiamine transporter ThiT [Eremococcus coleocola]EFR31339.1 hypothetical protein HMPREF9257_1268 [Eremococcus coleocola ACS-139-V-Col8]